MRGKHFYGFIPNRTYRITPADAGKTPTVVLWNV